MSERIFNIGDVVYNARCEWVEKQVLCPVCFGKRTVTLILGNDEHCVLPCDYCGKGFYAPTGYVREYDYIVDAECITITDINIEISSTKETHEYYYNHRSFDTGNLFLNKEDALVKAQEIKNQLDQEQSQRIEWLKQDKKKSFSWNAGYHLREAKRLRESAEFHDQKALLCKQRAKEVDTP